MHLPAHLPGPLRAAVGLVASAADEAKNLPDRAIELPMLAVSTALQLSLRAQQRYAALTVRGEEALSRGGASDEPPAWATFDDDPSDASEGRSTVPETSVTVAADDPADDPAEAPAPISGSGPVPADENFPDTDTDTHADTEAAPEPPAARKAPAKKQPTARKSPARKGAAKKATDASANGKGVSAPRHTPPSRFDTIGDE